MLKKIDLAALAEGIDLPYRPIPLATSGELEASLFICQGPQSWHRKIPRDELLIVLEGVITVESQSGKLNVDEGDLASAPHNAAYSVHSGMRSTVVLLEAVRQGRERVNGHHAPESDAPGTVGKHTVAVDVRQKTPFAWAEVAHAGQHTVHATRLIGASEPYRVMAGTVLVIVYRGVLDYRSPTETGGLVGSEMLVLSEGSEVTLVSETGATVFWIAATGVGVPACAVSGPSTPE